MAHLISGLKTVTTVGTAERISEENHTNTYMFRADPLNAGTYMYIGNDGSGDVSALTGMALLKTDEPITIRCALADLWVDTDTNGDTLLWMRVGK